jgi:hypothetical protein
VAFAAVDADDVEVQIGQLRQRGRPLAPRSAALPRTTPPLSGTTRLDIVGIPRPHPLVRERLRSGSRHGV